MLLREVVVVALTVVMQQVSDVSVHLSEAEMFETLSAAT